MRVFVITKEAIARIVLIAALAAASMLFILYTGRGATPAFGPKDNIPIYSVKTSGKQIAITLDAAWGTDKTAAILDILDKYHIKATFFVTGMWADKNEDVLKAIADRGHEIGNHSYTHRDFAQLGDADILKELERATASIERVTGKRTSIFRAPYGSWNARIVDVVCGAQYDFVQWDVDSLDWKGLTPESMEARIFPKVQSGSIILFHNDAKNIVEALPPIIEKLMADGYKPVTVTELVNESLEAHKN
jgi:polysaccharide deacetylase family sporulation protein PdaB